MTVPEPTQTSRPERRGFSFYFLSGIVILLALQGIIYLELVGNAIGPFTMFKKTKAPDPSLARELKVALLLSASNARMFAENPERYYAAERQWEAILKREGIPFRVISDADLAQDLGDANVLVLPGASCLGEAQRKIIQDFLADGRGVVASGSLGTRDDRCAWQGWDFLSRLTGIEKAETVASQTAAYATFRGQLYFSDRMPTGYRMEIPSQELTVASVKEPDAFWTDWMLRPRQGKSLTDSTLALHTQGGAGRIVWCGFGPFLLAEAAADQALLDRYLATSVLWAGKQPLAVVGNWPNTRQAAVLIVDEVDPDFANAEEDSRLFKQQGIPAIFVCPSAQAKTHPAALRNLESAGEIASAGDSLEPFGGEVTLQQADRLRRSKGDLEKVTRRAVLGFSPPQGLADTATVLALNAARYRYYLNEIAVSRAVPEIVEFTESVFFPFQKWEVAKIFRTSSDDLEALAMYQGPDPPGPGLAEGFLSDFRRSIDLGGVYTLYFHSYLLGASKYRPALTAILDNIRAQPAWITTGQNLVNWWLGRNKILAQVRKVGIRRLRLDVANTGLADLKDGSVYVYLPFRPRKIHVSSIVFHLQSPQIVMLDHDNILRLDFRKLGAQTYYIYTIGLDEDGLEE